MKKLKLNLFLCLLLMLIHCQAGAQSLNNSLQYMEYLKQQQVNLHGVIKQLEQSVKNIQSEDSRHRLQSASLLKQINQSRLTRLQQSLSSYLQSAKQYQTRKKQLIALQVNPLYKRGKLIEKKMVRIDKLIAVYTETIQILTQNIELSKRYASLLDEYLAQLHHHTNKALLEKKLGAYNAKQQQISNKISLLITKSIQLQKGSGEYSFDRDILLEVQLLLNNQTIKHLQLQNDLINIYKRLNVLELSVKKESKFEQAQTQFEAYQRLKSELGEIKEEAEHSISLLNEQAKVVSFSSIRGIKTFKTQQQKLIGQYKLLAQRTSEVNSEIDETINALNREIQKRFTTGGQLFEHRGEKNITLLTAMLEVPKRFVQHLGLLGEQIAQQTRQMSFENWLIMGIVSVLLMLLYVLIRWSLKHKLFITTHNRVSTQLLNTVFYLLQANIHFLFIVGFAWGLLKMAHVPYGNYQLMLTLAMAVLGFKWIISFARYTLYERISDTTGQDVKLFHQLRWCFSFGALFTCLMIISRTLLLPVFIQRALNWGFMLFLLSLGLVLMSSRHLIPGLLRPFMRSRRVYVKRFIRLLSFLIPFSLIVNGVTGLIGYIQLAWLMGYYQAIFIALLSLYVVARGILFDLLEIASEWMIVRLNNGWLWSEVFLKPLHKVLRIFLLIVFFIGLSLLYGWTTNELIISKIKAFFSYTLVDISGIHITVTSTLQFVILLSVFVWAAKWVREFCYRWLFKDIRDAGIRNSFSVFSQYALVLLGAVLTLRVLGVEFSGMSYVLGGLAVGMGFGLRDFASNIVGGLMLLIERPVREGDLITIGTHEGKVAHIGIRSMRVRSWDNMEVLIPNAETFNKPFTNWTHQDSVVRTVVPIKVQAAEDPVEVQQLIMDVLKIIPDVLEEPAPQVFLKQIDEALVLFEVRYFINIDQVSRIETRSKVLFAIAAQFKAVGIKPPIPPILIDHAQ